MAAGSLPFILPRVADEALEFEKYLNFLLALADRRARSEIVRARPFEVTIDPSTVCQLSCPYCEVGNKTITRKRAFLETGLHGRMLDQLGPGVFIAWYFSTGEPLLNKHFHEIVGRTRGRGIFSIVSTNLSLELSDQRIDDLLGCGLGVICVSLDGASPETYARYRVGGDFALVVENMRRLVQRKAQLGLRYPLIEWRFLVFRHNQHEIARVRELALEYGVDLLELYPGYAPPSASAAEVQAAADPALEPAVSGPALDAARRRRDSTLRARLSGARESHAPPPPAHMRYQKCDWLYLGTMLFPGGAVGPCCLSNNAPDDFGAITDQVSFGDVWNEASYRQARRIFVRDEPNTLVCSRCPNRDAQDYQFRMTLQALVRNAPDWALAILAQDPERFFFDLDLAWSRGDLGALADGSLEVRGPFPDVARRLEERAAHDEGAREQLLALRELLVASDAAPRARSRPWKKLYARVRDVLRGERPT